MSGIWVLICWIMVEDLIRKFAANNLGVYALKGLLLLVLIVGLLMDGRVRGSWKAATGNARIWFYCLIVWAIVMSIPSLFVSLNLPILGLSLDFAFAPLLIPAFFLARDPRSLRQMVFGITLILTLTVIVGVIQSVVGPSFLSPGVTPDHLDNLVIIRASANASGVYRPTGTFVDPGRYGSLTFICLAFTLSSVMIL